MEMKETEYTMETSDEFLVAGVAQRGTNVNPRELWSDLDDFEDGRDDGLRDAAVSEARYGVLFEFDEGSDEITYLVGREVESTDGLPAELTAVQIPEASYAVFSMQDVGFAEIDQMLNEMNEELFSDADHEWTAEPVFQQYTDTTEPFDSEASFELFVPVDED